MNVGVVICGNVYCAAGRPHRLSEEPEGEAAAGGGCLTWAKMQRHSWPTFAAAQRVAIPAVLLLRLKLVAISLRYV